MELLAQVIDAINNVLRWPLVIGLLGTGLFLTFKLGFIQFRRLGHGFAVATGRYDDPDEPGDVSHFQALTTALSATVGVGNIAGVALAIHIGGPGALFWMWVTALLGHGDEVRRGHAGAAVPRRPRGRGRQGVGGLGLGRSDVLHRAGLGKKWKPVAVFFAFALMVTSFMTGNAVQANTVATQVFDSFGVEPWITGLITATIVGVVILGGISRIGKVTSIVAPVMAAVYVAGALTILIINIGDLPGAFGRIFTEAFNPRSGVAGTGAGVFLLTMLYGVQRGLFSNEAGQGSAPIAHSAAKTDEPVSEGAVALLEPFIDTILICTMTGLVLITTGAFEATAPAPVDLGASNVSIVEGNRESGFTPYLGQDAISYKEGMAQALDGPRVGRFNVGVDTLYVDEAQTIPFSGTVDAGTRAVVDDDGNVIQTLYGNTVRTSAPLTTLAFETGLAPIGLGGLGGFIVLISVILFAISTSISWSYYGDRCANYLFGSKAILPFKAIFVVMHFVGAVLAVTTIWDLGDVALSLVTLPNVLALLLLSPVLKKLTDSYFERRPWEQNEIDHKRAKEEGRL